MHSVKIYIDDMLNQTRINILQTDLAIKHGHTTADDVIHKIYNKIAGILHNYKQS